MSFYRIIHKSCQIRKFHLIILGALFGVVFYISVANNFYQTSVNIIHKIIDQDKKYTVIDINSFRHEFDNEDEMIIVEEERNEIESRVEVPFDSNLPEFRKSVLRTLDSIDTNHTMNTIVDDHGELDRRLVYTNSKLGQIPSISGFLNQYIWPDICATDMESLRARLDFPYNPWRKLNTRTLSLIIKLHNIGMRIFGYLKPPVDGKYILKGITNGKVEVWLSSDASPSYARLCKFTHNKYTVYFQKDKHYYIEILFASAHLEKIVGILSLEWLIPGNKHGKQSTISPDYLVPYTEENLNIVIPETYRPIVPLPMHALDPKIRSILEQREEFEENSFNSYDVITRASLASTDKSMFECDYKPHFVETKQIQDPGELCFSKYFRKYARYLPYFEFEYRTSLYLKFEEVRRVVFQYLRVMDYIFGQLHLQSILNFEKLEDANGDLYFVDLLVSFGQSAKVYSLSDYFVNGSAEFKHSICFPRMITMRQDTFIHIQVTHRNFPTMMRYFVENWEMIYEVTGDDNFELIILNYPSPKLDVEQLLRQSKIKRWRLIELKDPFSKVIAINLGIDSVKNPNDIIFTADLSMHYPPQILDSIRKHTFQGYSAYAPICYYFECTLPYTKGQFYSDWGFGLLAMYKSDWAKLHGMNTVQFGEEWGLEDTDIAKRILTNGYLLIRLDLRGCYHQSHSYKGLWDVTDH